METTHIGAFSSWRLLAVDAPRWWKEDFLVSHISHAISHHHPGPMELFLGQYLGHHTFPKDMPELPSRKERETPPPSLTDPASSPNPPPPPLITPSPNASLIASSHAHTPHLSTCHKCLTRSPSTRHTRRKTHTQIFHHINYYAVLIPARPPAILHRRLPSTPTAKRKTTGCFYLYMLIRHAPHAPAAASLLKATHPRPHPKNAAHAC